MGLYFCLASFAVTLLLSRRSLALGVNSVLTVGYLYGIVRANYLDTYSHFMFDCAVFGCYLSLLIRGPSRSALGKSQELQRWVFWLLGLAVAMFFVPFQHPLIQLVGLRGNAFLLPRPVYTAGRVAFLRGPWQGGYLDSLPEPGGVQFRGRGILPGRPSVLPTELRHQDHLR
jgi:hypothetical protein